MNLDVRGTFSPDSVRQEVVDDIVFQLDILGIHDDYSFTQTSGDC